MQQSLPSTVKVLGFALAVSFVTACAAYPPIASAQGNVGTNIRVLVAGEDSDPTTVVRSSDIFKRVIAALQGTMQRDGFRMIDEESVATDLGWPIPDRRSKRQIIQTIKNMTTSVKASHQVRAWVLFRIHAQAIKFDSSAKMRVRIDGEIYDAANNTLDDVFEPMRMEFPAPLDCLESKICQTETVGDRAREIASGLGRVLATKLERYSPPRSRVEAGHGKLTSYTVELRDFENREAIVIIDVMSDEFPGFENVELIWSNAAVRRYDYLTTAKRAKLEEWLYILLRDMGFDAERKILIEVQGTNIIVNKLESTPDRPASRDETKRFK